MVFESVVEACDFGLNVLAVVMIRIYDGKSQSFIAQMLEYSSAVPTPYLAYLELQVKLKLQAHARRNVAPRHTVSVKHPSTDSADEQPHEVLPRFIHRVESVSHQGPYSTVLDSAFQTPATESGVS